MTTVAAAQLNSLHGISIKAGENYSQPIINAAKGGTTVELNNNAHLNETICYKNETCETRYTIDNLQILKSWMADRVKVAQAVGQTSKLIYSIGGPGSTTSDTITIYFDPITGLPVANIVTSTTAITTTTSTTSSTTPASTSTITPETCAPCPEIICGTPEPCPPAPVCPTDAATSTASSTSSSSSTNTDTSTSASAANTNSETAAPTCPPPVVCPTLEPCPPAPACPTEAQTSTSSSTSSSSSTSTDTSTSSSASSTSETAIITCPPPVCPTPPPPPVCPEPPTCPPCSDLTSPDTSTSLASSSTTPPVDIVTNPDTSSSSSEAPTTPTETTTTTTKEVTTTTTTTPEGTTTQEVTTKTITETTITASTTISTDQTTTLTPTTTTATFTTQTTTTVTNALGETTITVGETSKPLPYTPPSESSTTSTTSEPATNNSDCIDWKKISGCALLTAVECLAFINRIVNDTLVTTTTPAATTTYAETTTTQAPTAESSTAGFPWMFTTIAAGAVATCGLAAAAFCCWKGRRSKHREVSPMKEVVVVPMRNKTGHNRGDNTQTLFSPSERFQTVVTDNDPITFIPGGGDFEEGEDNDFGHNLVTNFNHTYNLAIIEEHKETIAKLKKDLECISKMRITNYEGILAWLTYRENNGQTNIMTPKSYKEYVKLLEDKENKPTKVDKKKYKKQLREVKELHKTFVDFNCDDLMDYSKLKKLHDYKSDQELILENTDEGLIAYLQSRVNGKIIPEVTSKNKIKDAKNGDENDQKIVEEWREEHRIYRLYVNTRFEHSAKEKENHQNLLNQISELTEERDRVQKALTEANSRLNKAKINPGEDPAKQRALLEREIKELTEEATRKLDKFAKNNQELKNIIQGLRAELTIAKETIKDLQEQLREVKNDNNILTTQLNQAKGSRGSSKTSMFDDPEFAGEESISRRGSFDPLVTPPKKTWANTGTPQQSRTDLLTKGPSFVVGLRDAKDNKIERKSLPIYQKPDNYMATGTSTLGRRNTKTISSYSVRFCKDANIEICPETIYVTMNPAKQIEMYVVQYDAKDPAAYVKLLIDEEHLKGFRVDKTQAENWKKEIGATLTTKLEKINKMATGEELNKSRTHIKNILTYKENLHFKNPDQYNIIYCSLAELPLNKKPSTIYVYNNEGNIHIVNNQQNIIIRKEEIDKLNQDLRNLEKNNNLSEHELRELQEKKAALKAIYHFNYNLSFSPANEKEEKKFASPIFGLINRPRQENKSKDDEDAPTKEKENLPGSIDLLNTCITKFEGSSVPPVKRLHKKLFEENKGEDNEVLAASLSTKEEKAILHEEELQKELNSPKAADNSNHSTPDRGELRQRKSPHKTPSTPRTQLDNLIRNRFEGLATDKYASPKK